ncbi:hypothetical protein H0H92_006808 [Tricholoma furcatifolium]|nr:hypothetical protein H0H92_006808 [Tricholoma furcatifolium]
MLMSIPPMKRQRIGMVPTLRKMPPPTLFLILLHVFVQVIIFGHAAHCVLGDWCTQAQIDQVNTTESYIDALRPASTKAAKRPRVEPDCDDDGFEHTLRLPRSVLDECEESFTAADG